MEVVAAIIVLALVLAPLIAVVLGGRSGPAASGDPAPPRAPRTTAPPTVRPPQCPLPRRLSGRAWVIDGDTIAIRGTKIRLSGIDAPELDRPFGRKAKWAMVDICAGHVITAELSGETSHDRLVGTCYLPDGRDIAGELVSRGLALDWPVFSGGRYRALEPPGVRRQLRARFGR